MIRTSLRRVALLLSLVALGGCIDRGSGVTQPGTTGSLQITVSGLPNGAAPSITVSGPSGFSTSLNGSKTLSDLTPGTYTITAAQVVSGTATYAPVPTQTTVSVIASTTPATAGIAYQLASGSLTVSIGGLPTGVAGSVLVSGPSGFTQTLGSTQTLANLKPGSYTVTPNSIVSGGTRYSAGAIQTVTVNATIAATIATVTYVVSSGSLSITVSGLPNGANASVSITGPGSFSQTITASQTLQLLTPGTYTIAANPVSVSSQLWSGTPASQSVSVIASTTAATASVTYSQTTAQLTVTISGLPGGTNADVTVTGPGAFSQHLTASAVLNNLALGTYTISAANVSTATALYGPSAASQTVTFSTSLTSATKTVTYSQISGALTVTVSGLPNGVNAAVTVTGPGSFSQSVTATTTITKLTTGTYTIAAANVTSGSTTYAPAPSSQTATVNAGATASATVTYSAVSPGGVNLTIDGLYITQSTQNYAGSIPLIKDRNGFLRVFVKADQANSVQPQVRVRIYNGASLVQTYTINAPGASVPTAINEGALASSWNVAVPGSLIQPGYKILADVDPTNSITESNEADNCFPVSCSAQSMSVQTATTFNITLVPVKQSVNNLTGNATSANKDQILSMTMGIHPLPGYNAVVRSVYTTNAPALASDGTNWITVLNEIQALRVADSTASPYHGTYYGVVAVSYGSGVAGLGYIGYPAAIGWDYASSAPRIAAHELGHTFGRLHAPCGNPAGPDPNWPTDPGHTNAHLGTYGYDVANNVLYAPSTNYDVMSYCTPQWISDYTYQGVMTYRAANPDVVSAAAASVQPALLVWGRVQNGRLQLEPAFEVNARPVLPKRGGPYTVQGLDVNGAPLFSYSFDVDPVADLGAGDGTFAFAIPLGAVRQDLAELRVSGAGQQLRVVSQPLAIAALRRAPTLPAKIIHGGAQEVALEWDAVAFPEVMVRDPKTGEVLSIARGGRSSLFTSRSTLELVFSDGVRSVVKRAAVQ